MNINTERHGKIHIVGIGGAGMSAIALLLKAMGFYVQGSDLKSSSYTEILKREGIPVFIGHSPDNLRDSRTVIYSTAVPRNNPELLEAQRRGLSILHRSDALGIITEGKKVVAVTGTHGKTTTTSLVAHCLRCAGIDAGFLVGGEVNDYGTNARYGTDVLFVVEADESDGSFLKLKPSYAVFTNLEEEHMDFYGTEEFLNESAAKFLSSSEEFSVLFGDDRRLKKISRNVSSKIVTYGTEDCDYRVLSYKFGVPYIDFELQTPEGKKLNFSIKLKGYHNILNSAACAALLLEMGLSHAEVFEGLRTFSGVGRRLEVIGSIDGIDIIDDYAHHPTEIKATLDAVKTAPYARVIAVFQPHRYTRTEKLFSDFPEAFASADVVIATDIYSAGENPIPGVTGKLLFERIAERNSGKKLAYIPRLLEIPSYIIKIARKGDAVVFLGAGDITLAARETVKLLLQI
jgi:UDP-N-acetylmuramate--alanine ligase